MPTKIIVIDDDLVDLVDLEDIQRKLDQLLAKHQVSGIEVCCFSSPFDGLSAVEHEEVALVILDIFIPEKDGIEILQEIAKLERVIPVLLTTGADPSMMKVANSIGKMSGIVMLGQEIKPVAEGFFEAILKDIGVFT